MLNYVYIMQNYGNPFYEKRIKKRKTVEYFDYLKKSQWWTQREIQDFQFNEFKNLIKTSYNQVPYWHEKIRNNNLSLADFKSLNDLYKLPILSKEEIKKYKDKMINCSEEPLLRKFTGGSTGSPLEIFYTKKSNQWRTAITSRGYSWAGADPFIKRFLVWGSLEKEDIIIKIKKYLHHKVSREEYFYCRDLDFTKINQCIKRVNIFRPEIIIGYTNPLVSIAKHILQYGGLQHKAKGIISAAEKLYSENRKLLESAFECPVYNSYGCREFMLIGCECEMRQGLHISQENLIVEIIKDNGEYANEGEQGEIVVTDLHNYGMPFIRYATGDLGIIKKSMCKCGRGLTLLEDVVGRKLDIIRTSEKEIPGESFVIIMLDKKGFNRYRFIQKSLKKIVVQLEKNDFFREHELVELKAQIKRLVGDSVEIFYEFPSEIELTPSGKLRVTISEIQ